MNKNLKKLVGKSTTWLPSVNEEIGKSIQSASKFHINAYCVQETAPMENSCVQKEQKL